MDIQASKKRMISIAALSYKNHKCNRKIIFNLSNNKMKKISLLMIYQSSFKKSGMTKIKLKI